MLKWSLLIMLFFGAVGVHAQQDRECLHSYRKGVFIYEGKESGVKIIRTRKRQTEIYNNGASKIILKIEWPNDSTYVLTHIKSINAPGCLDPGDTIVAVIDACLDNKYKAYYSSNKCGNGTNVFIRIE